MPKQDGVIIVGSGLAGLACAARLVELGVERIRVYARGLGGTPFVAAINFVLPDNPYGDEVELYVEDMLSAGYRLGDRELVRTMCANTMNGYELLQRWGITFAQKADGSILLRHVSGHTHPRSLCATDELIGARITRIMRRKLKEAGVTFCNAKECVGLLTSDGRICGATFRDSRGNMTSDYSSVVVAAWGGIGHLLGASTYPEDIQGNTLAIAHDAGAELIDLEFIEYEPMVVLDPPGAVGEPCPTAMLGEGGQLLNSEGERFLLKVRPQGEGGAHKTLINREIWKQVQAGKGSPHGGCWVDLRHIDPNILKAYPWFYNRLVRHGTDPAKQLVEVGPMPHSFAGGIQIGADYQSTVPGLYAIGEACGGVHGACRCAGNAGSQAALSGLLSAEAIAAAGVIPAEAACKAEEEYKRDDNAYGVVMRKAREIAAGALGIYRDAPTLEKAREGLKLLLDTPEAKADSRAGQAVESMLLIVNAALARKESRGAHMRTDYPEMDKRYER